MNPIDLTGRIALVTGGGTGIGLMIAKTLSKNGAKVYITGRRVEVLKKTASDLSDYKLNPHEGFFFRLQMDVGDKESIRNAVKTIDQAEGKLDILVNNAGVTGKGFQFVNDRGSPENQKMGELLFDQSTFEAWTEVYHTNTVGPFFVTMGFLSLLVKGAESRKGETSSVVNISSGAGSLNVTMGNFSYGPTKTALDQVTKNMATEFGLSKIPVRVNCITPGVFPSELAGPSEQVAQWVTGPLPGAVNPSIARRAGKEEEIGTVVVFLSSAAGEFTNGIVMPVDGGHNLVNF
ncbi:short-chain dehydrogenase [Dendrothele bispora CBS 962.96]|uniref:Short-chain dehydrogenase n=1 Tax=Dendrothele bispora (strain CBS 962.96) TaxID=1314807 RepID=A0A4S8LWW7_DENBC|nr:short-chain dehydrogenase [Dendrothele bispora CBS 962.96]